MYRAVTRKIEVTVTPRFVSERSSPNNGYFFWAYTINIANLGGETVQLKTRHWRITDALGRLQEVKGPGVVGKSLRSSRLNRSSTQVAFLYRHHRVSWSAVTAW